MTLADATLAFKPHRLAAPRTVIAACAVLSLVLAAPILAMSVPWFCDLYFHMARMAILEHPQAAYISDWYRPDWRLVPNLAMDLIVPTLGSAIGTAAATRIFVALTLVLTFTGTVALHRAIHRKAAWLPLIAALFVALTLVLTFTGTVALHRAIHRRAAWFPLIAALFVYNWVTFLGFANVLFSNALLLWALALWFHSRARTLPVRIVLGAACALILYTCHLFSLGLYGLVIASAELARLQQTPPSLREIGRSLALTVAPFVIPLALLLTSRTVEASAPGVHYVLAAKLFALLTPFVTINLPVDLAIAGGTIALFYWLVRERALYVAPELRFALAALPLLVLAIPTSFFGTDLADFRLPAVSIFIAIAACRFSERCGQRLQRGVLAGVAVLFALRMTAIAIDFATAEPEIKAITQQYGAMKPGAVLFTGTFEHNSFLVDLFGKPENWLMPWQRRNVVPFRHIGTMAVLYQPVLVPETTMIDGQQPVAMRPPFRALKALQSQEHVARGLADADELDAWLLDIKTTIAGEPYRFTAVYIALSDPHDVATPPTGIVERFAQYNYRIWDATEWMAR